MTGMEALRSVRFVQVEGRRFAVIPAEDWEVMIEWLESLEDLQVARAGLAELRKAEGDRERAGWLRWADLRRDL
jgi:hypothetical protein